MSKLDSASILSRDRSVPDSIPIRIAGPADAAAILALEESFPTDRLSARSVRALLRSPSARIWIAERGGEPLGSIVLFMPRGRRFARIYSVVVAPAARGNGLGDRLVGIAEDAAAAARRDTMTLEVREDNAVARALYTRRGYTLREHLEGYYEDGADGLRLRKTLPVK
jgi:ribosomal protein S18 acetylase RimI-like enzyme